MYNFNIDNTQLFFIFSGTNNLVPFCHILKYGIVYYANIVKHVLNLIFYTLKLLKFRFLTAHNSSHYFVLVLYIISLNIFLLQLLQ